MKSKKVTMLAAALVVAVVAAAGIGFATTYTATTTNTNNQLDSTYITVSQDGTALYAEDFLSSIYFDTVNTAVPAADYSTTNHSYTKTTTYSPVVDYVLKEGTYTNNLETGDVARFALVSNILTLKFDKTSVPAAEQTVRLEVEVTKFTPVNGLVYTMVLTNASSTTITPVSNTATATINGSSASGETQTFEFTGISIATVENFNVYLFISLESEPVTDANAANIAHAGFNIGSSGTSIVDSVFTFKAIATAS